MEQAKSLGFRDVSAPLWSSLQPDNFTKVANGALAPPQYRQMDLRPTPGGSRVPNLSPSKQYIFNSPLPASPRQTVDVQLQVCPGVIVHSMGVICHFLLPNEAKYTTLTFI